MQQRATLEHFDRVFTQSADPWCATTRRDETHKRKVILQMLGSRAHGRMLELGCGNGSNTRVLADRARLLDACDGSVAALKRAARTVNRLSNVRLHHVPLPARFPGGVYDAIVVSELLYYLDDRTLTYVTGEIARTLRPSGVLVLCHHHQKFADACQQQLTLHRRFVVQPQIRWQLRRQFRTNRWEALSLCRICHKRKNFR